MVYTLAVRSLDGCGPGEEGLDLYRTGEAKGCRPSTTVNFVLKNTGEAGPGRDDPAFGSDVYRLSVSVEGKGWTAKLPNALAAVKAGQIRKSRPSMSSRENGASDSAKITLKAVSESDLSKTDVVTATVSR